MSRFSIFKRKHKKIEKKSNGSFDLSGFGLFDGISAKFDSHVSISEQLRYYRICAPVFTGIKIISDQIACINPVIFDKKSKQIVRDHPFLELLKHPNFDETQQEFFEAFATYLLATGNNITVAMGDIDKPPLELFIESPQDATIQTGSDGFPDKYTLQFGNMTTTFNRRESPKDKRMRFLSGDMRELYHTKSFNTHKRQRLFGMSPLNPLFYDINQWIQSSEHNLSVLERSANLSGALTTDQSLSDDQFERLNAEIRNSYSGSSNAGRIALFDAGITFKDMTPTNRDMDYNNLKSSVVRQIYTTLNIPIPLIDTGAQTFSNFSAARIMLYEQAVIPLIKRIYFQLTDFLMQRYPGSENLILSFVPSEIPSLEAKMYETAKTLKDVGVLTANEIRTLLDYEALDGGNTLLVPANLVPVATDQFTDDELSKPLKAQNILTFIKDQKKPDGEHMFSPDEVSEIMKRVNKTACK